MRISTPSSAVAIADERPTLRKRSRTVRRRVIRIAIVCDRALWSDDGRPSSPLCGHLLRVLGDNNICASFTDTWPASPESRAHGVLLLSDVNDPKRTGLDVPVVGLNVPATDGISTICVDYRQQSENVVDYLYERGHRRIAIVLGQDENWAAVERRKGFVEAMRRRDLAVSPDHVFSTMHQPVYGVLNRLVSYLKPTAAFLACEGVSIESASILRGMAGGQIPEELSLIGLETSHVSRFHSPPLTTIAQPTEQLALAAVRMLMRQVKSHRVEPEHIVLESKLIERASVRMISST